MKEQPGSIEGNIGRCLKNRKVMAVPDGEFGKYAKTNYQVLERLGYISLVECKLRQNHKLECIFNTLSIFV